MIHSVSANQPAFRRVQFSPGLNVIVAERTQQSGKKDTRNGLGKSTLIDIIDFCLGGSSDKGKRLNIPALQAWSFTLDITLRERRVKVTRAVAAANRIIIDGSSFGWPISPDTDEESGLRSYSLANWRLVLGHLLFGLGDIEGEERHKPSYRSLISYFIRTKPGAYLDPFKYLPQQRAIVSKVNIAYLLGLSWEDASKVQVLEDTELGLGALQSGKLEEVGSVGELEAQRVQLEQKAAETHAAVDSFLVHPQYQEIQKQADDLTKELHAIANDNVSDRRKLARYQESLTDEATPEHASLERLYEEAGVVFSDGLKRTLAQAKEFHQTIVSNRREFLEAEVQSIDSAIAERESAIESLTRKRAAALDILKTHGALQEMTKLQERNVQTQTERDRIASLIDELKNAAKRKRKVKQDKDAAIKVLEIDHDQRRQVWEKAIRLFNANSQALYETPGKLVIDVTDSGYAFRVEIQRSGSEGIDKMKVFCFDLALLELRLASAGQINFLIHDTLMYDAVDPRQRARALERAHKVTSAADAQYICTMNSDMVPNADFSADFDFSDCVRLTLTDESEAGRLLGMTFERPGR